MSVAVRIWPDVVAWRLAWATSLSTVPPMPSQGLLPLLVAINATLPPVYSYFHVDTGLQNSCFGGTMERLVAHANLQATTSGHILTCIIGHQISFQAFTFYVYQTVMCQVI